MKLVEGMALPEVPGKADVQLHITCSGTELVPEPTVCDCGLLMQRHSISKLDEYLIIKLESKKSRHNHVPSPLLELRRDELEMALSMLVDHWDKFGADDGFGEIMSTARKVLRVCT